MAKQRFCKNRAHEHRQVPAWAAAPVAPLGWVPVMIGRLLGISQPGDPTMPASAPTSRGVRLAWVALAGGQYTNEGRPA